MNVSKNKLHKPYEIHYHITRNVDNETGKVTYTQGFRISESHVRAYRPRGVLHKIDNFRRNNIHSDVAGIMIVPHVILHSRPARAVKYASHFAAKKAANTRIGKKTLRIAHSAANAARSVSHTKIGKVTGFTLKHSIHTVEKVSDLACKTVFKTGLAAETAALYTYDSIKAKSKAALDAKVRQEAQDDGSKAGILIAAHSWNITRSTVSHFHNKRINKAFHRDFKSQIKNVNFENMPKVTKIDKIHNKQNKARKKLYKLQNKSLARKGAEGLAHNLENTFKNQVHNATKDNDAAMAAGKIISVADKVRKKRNSHQKYNNRLRKYNQREEKFHKKTVKKNNKSKKKKSGNNTHAKDVYKKYAEKQAKRVVIKRKASRFGLITAGVLAPIMLIPLLLVSCLGIFANNGTFQFVTAYYGASEEYLTSASERYQKLAYDMNKFVLSVPEHWSENLSKLNIPSNYSDAPVRFIFGNSQQLPSDTTYDFDKHKLYSFLCAYLLQKRDDGSVKQWMYTDAVEKVVDQLFAEEYEFNSYYDNSSRWEIKYQYYEPFDGAFWSVTDCSAVNKFDSNGNPAGFMGTFTFGNGLPDCISSFSDDQSRIYYNFDNGEILNANSSFAATGWYFKNQTYTQNDNSGTQYVGWYHQGDDGQYYYDVGDDTYQQSTISWNLDGNSIRSNYVVHQNDWNTLTGDDNTNHYIQILQKYDRITDCTLFYTVNRKKTFDEAVHDILYTFEDGESRYNYYLMLSPDTEPLYYGLHQVGTSPVYQGYYTMLTEGYIGHGFGWEMKEWNTQDCDFTSNNTEHSGISIIQNSGSNIYAMIRGKIIEIGDNYFILEGISQNREKHVTLDIVYCNVDTSGLTVNQEVKKGDIIAKTNNRRQEAKYLKTLTIYDSGSHIELVTNDNGYDYLNITCYSQLSGFNQIIDPEIILSLSDKE